MNEIVRPKFLANGVKTRFDDLGDAWAKEHRQMGKPFYMQDLDGFFGLVAFEYNSAEKLFVEYVIGPSSKEREPALREFAVVALFDRKLSTSAAFHEKNALSREFYMWMCRLFSRAQPSEPRFFYVTGGQEPPWFLVEVNVWTGESTTSGAFPRMDNAQDMRRIWDELGLTKLRNELSEWKRNG